MHKGLLRFYSGDFYGMGQEWHEDGTVTITLWEKGAIIKYRFRVKDLRGINEEVLEDEEIIISSTSSHVLQRLKEAKIWKEEKDKEKSKEK